MALFRFRVSDATGVLAGFRGSEIALEFAQSWSAKRKIPVFVVDSEHGKEPQNLAMFYSGERIASC